MSLPAVLIMDGTTPRLWQRGARAEIALLQDSQIAGLLPCAMMNMASTGSLGGLLLDN